MSNDEPFVTISDLAKHFSVSAASIRTWVRQGRIPWNTYIKAGSTYRFKISAVAKALLEEDNNEEPAEGGEDAPVQLCFDFSEDEEQDDQN